MNPTPTSIDAFFRAAGAPIPPNTPALPLAIQLMHLHGSIGRWYFFGRVPRHTLTLHSALLATPLIQDIFFHLSEVPEEIRRSYATWIFPYGQEVIHRDRLLSHLTQRIATCNFDTVIVMNTDCLILLMRYEKTDAFLMIDVTTRMIRYKPTVESCMNDLPDCELNVLPAGIGINRMYSQ